MKRIKKIKELENRKQKYILLREYAIYCKSYIDDMNLKEQDNVSDKESVKTLVLTKPFYGKQFKID